MPKISQYSNGSAVQDNDKFIIERGGFNYYILGSNLGGGTYGDLFGSDGIMLNGKISVSVASNNITVSLKTIANANPSASDPIYVRINGTVRSITSSLSVTLNAGTNYFNSGGSELATYEIDYFVYLCWVSASSVVSIGFSRFPYGTLYSSFSGTSTNEKYGAFSTTPAAANDVVNIGRFSATLSAGAGYTWTVPTFTSTNLKNSPTFETRQLNWAPVHSRSSVNYTNLPSINTATYQIIGRTITFLERHTQNATPGGSGRGEFTLPFTPLSAYSPIPGFNETSGWADLSFSIVGTSRVGYLKYDGTVDVAASNIYDLYGSLLLT